jgi:small-conductance mechanosensitive channel
VAAGLVLAAYSVVIAIGDLDCEETTSCEPVTGAMKWVFGLALVTVVVATLVALVRAGLRPRPFRTTTARTLLLHRRAHRDVRRRRPAEAFEHDLGLQVRMVVALVLAAAIVLAVVGGLVAFSVGVDGGWTFTFFILCFVIVGLTRGRRAEHRRDRRRARAPAPHDRSRAAGLLERLCVVGDLDAPDVAIERGRAPLSWTTAGLRSSRPST